ncbi:MAG: hypothetical protein HYR84_03385 [Planctomycetes bacterium]|nr:hypothetical protein [Planctomycetota bacterium]
MIRVRGKVYFDGKLLEKGLVQFESVEGNKPSSKGGVIENGDFTAEASAGEMIVRITSPKFLRKQRLMPEDPNSPERDITEERLPAKYHVKSMLKATIKSGMEDLEFKLDPK